MKTKSAAEFFGSKKKLAAALGISPSAVTMWGDEVPELRKYQIERLTRGKVKLTTPTTLDTPAGSSEAAAG